MFIRGFKSNLPETPYAPTWDFKIGTSLCENIDLKSLSKFLLSKEKEIKKLSLSYDKKNNIIDAYTGLGRNSTTIRFSSYNILKWQHPEILKLKYYITENLYEYNDICGNKTPNKVRIQCWVNILRFGQKIKPHLHSTNQNTYLSGHFNVSTNGTSTVYMSPINQLNDPEVIDIKNKEGEMTLFPSYIIHYTTRHYSLSPRITIAFDISIENGELSDNWVNL